MKFHRQYAVSLFMSFSPELSVISSILLHLHVCSTSEEVEELFQIYFDFQTWVCLDSFESRTGEFSCLNIRTVPSKVLSISRQTSAQGRCDRTYETLAPLWASWPTEKVVAQQLGVKESMRRLKWYLVPIFRPLSQSPNVIFWSKSYPRKGICLETLSSFHLYSKRLSRHAVNVEGQDKRPSLCYIQASGSLKVQDSSSNLVISAGDSIELGHKIGPGGWGHVGQQDALGLSSSREGCCFAIGPEDILQHCRFWASQHTQLVKAVCELHMAQYIALVIWRSISRAPGWRHRPAMM